MQRASLAIGRGAFVFAVIHVARRAGSTIKVTCARKPFHS
jgi:hypothetical protein